MTPKEFLAALMARAEDNPNSLAIKAKATQSTIFRFLEGESQEPRKSTLDKIARVYNVPVEAFYSDKIRALLVKQMGFENTGGTLEAILVQEPTLDYNVAPGPDMRAPLPLISWVQAGDWSEIIDNFAPGDAETWLPCPSKHGSRAYALRVEGVSMEPKFHSGDIIFVDPDLRAEHGSYVVVRLDDEKKATFKQLVIEGDQRFLRPENPAWPQQLIPINGNATICGVVIGRYEKM